MIALAAGPAAALLAVPVAAQPIAAHGFDYARFNSELNRFERDHPHDWVGTSALLRSWGVSQYRVTIPALGLRDATAAAAEDAYTRLARSQGTSLSPSAMPSLDPNVLSVSGSTALMPTGEYLVEGDWNFSDSFVGMTSPADLASLEFSSKCWKGARAYFSIYDYQGNGHSSLGYWTSANPSTFTHVLAVGDKSVAFVAYNDNGNERYFLQSTGCFTRDIAASFQYEHNQGGGLAGFSVGFGILSVSYSGSDLRLQKSTGVFH